MQEVKNYRGAAKTIFSAGIAAGITDIAAAFLVYALIQHKTTPVKILQSVASGIFGKQAFNGGSTMAMTGLLIHFLIAVCFASGYYITFINISYLRKHPFLSGLAYGIVVWILMNLVVLPLRFGYAPSLNITALPGILILMVCFGLPVSLITHYHSTRTK